MTATYPIRKPWRAVFASFVLLICAFALLACEAEEGEADTGQEEQVEQLGDRVYNSYCTTCHQPQGQGVPNAYPPLSESEWVQGDEGRLIRLVLHGVEGPMEVQDETYNQPMIAHGHLSDEEIAAVLTYIRQNFGNDAGAVTPDEVETIRAAEDRDERWEASELWEQTGIPEQ